MTVIIPTTENVARPQAWGYDGSIDNVLIRLGVTEETPLEDMTAEAAPPKVDTSDSPEDIRDEVGQRYSRSNLSGGAGLDFLHSPKRKELDSVRFWDSKHVDVFGSEKGKRYSSRLMRTTEAITAEGATGVIDIVDLDGTVYYVNATGIYEYGNPTIKATIAGVTRMVSLGNSVYTLNSAGVSQFTPSVNWTPTVIDATVFDNIWAAKGRIVASDDNTLLDVEATVPLILTLATGEEIIDIVDAGVDMLAFTTDGTVYAFTADTDSLLILSGESSFIDEIPVCASYAYGVIGICTAELNGEDGRVARFYTASLDEHQLVDLALIFQVGNRDSTDDLTPHATVATRDSIYAAIPEEGETEITVWRYFLPTGGYARAHSIDPAAAHSISTLIETDDRMWAAVPGKDIYRETDDYETVGWIIGPLADHYTADPKQWVAGELAGDELPLGCGLELYQTTDADVINLPDSPLWQLVCKLNPEDISATATLYAGLESRYHAAKIVLRSDSTRVFTAGFQTYSFRSLPNPDRDILVRIPLNVSDQIDSPGKRSVSIKGRGLAIENVLRRYEGKQVSIELFRPELQVRGLIEAFESTIETISQRGAVRRIMYCRIRGTYLDDGDSAYGGSTTGTNLGMGTLGLYTLGTREIGTP